MLPCWATFVSQIMIRGQLSLKLGRTLIFDRSRDTLTPISLSVGRLMNRLTSDIGIIE